MLGTEEQEPAGSVRLAAAKEQERLVAQELALLGSEGRGQLDAVVRKLPVAVAASAQ